MVLRPSIPICASVVALLAGCAAGPGTGSADSDAGTANHARQHAGVPTWASRVDTIELEAERLTFEQNGHVLGTRSLRHSRSALTVLTAVLGFAKKSSTDAGDGGACLPASTSYLWDGGLRVTALTKPSSVGNEIDVRLLAPTVTAKDGRSITLEGPGDVRVGDDLTTEIAASPTASKEQLQGGTDTAWQVVLQPGWAASDSTGEVDGVSALTDGTTVTVIGAPMAIPSSDDC